MHRIGPGCLREFCTQKAVSIAGPREQILALSNGAFPPALLRRMRLQHFASLWPLSCTGELDLLAKTLSTLQLTTPQC